MEYTSIFFSYSCFADFHSNHWFSLKGHLAFTETSLNSLLVQFFIRSEEADLWEENVLKFVQRKLFQECFIGTFFWSFNPTGDYRHK